MWVGEWEGEVERDEERVYWLLGDSGGLAGQLWWDQLPLHPLLLSLEEQQFFPAIAYRSHRYMT